MKGHGARLLLILVSASGFVGCGITVPDIKEPWDVDEPADAENPKIPGAAQMEFEIKKRIYCDLSEAVREVNKAYPTVPGGLLPKNWGAQVSLSLQVDETSSLNPGLTLNTTYPTVISYPATKNALGALAATTTSQSFGLGFGATVSSTATRVDKFDPYYSIAYLMKPDRPGGVCFPGKPYTQNDPFLRRGWTPAASSPFIVESDLGIKDWLMGAMIVDNALPSEGPTPTGGGSAPSGKDTVSLEIKFVIITSGNVTPTWKLVRVSTNTGSTPFFNTGRTRTHDLIITIGAPGDNSKNTHLASQIGNAVSNANRAIFMAPGSQ
jgi:hypothetical protein